jgi:hypothetical protein
MDSRIVTDVSKKLSASVFMVIALRGQLRPEDGNYKFLRTVTVDPSTWPNTQSFDLCYCR